MTAALLRLNRQNNYYVFANDAHNNKRELHTTTFGFGWLFHLFNKNVKVKVCVENQHNKMKNIYVVKDDFKNLDSVRKYQQEIWNTKDPGKAAEQKDAQEAQRQRSLTASSSSNSSDTNSTRSDDDETESQT